MSRDGTGTGTGESRALGPPPAHGGREPDPAGSRDCGRGGRCRGWTGAEAGRRHAGSATRPLHARPGESLQLFPREIPAKVRSPPRVRERRVPAVPAGRGMPLLEHNRRRLPSPRHCTAGAMRRAQTPAGTCPGTRRCFLRGWGVLGGLSLSHLVLPVHDAPLPCLPHGLGGSDRSPTNTLDGKKAEEGGCKKLCSDGGPRMGHLSDMGQQNIPVRGDMPLPAEWVGTRQRQLGGQTVRVPKDLAVTV